ncbi:MAG: ferritin-like domain-containing protein [Acidobacteriia bacterium]|nr:ferritin-like domain-containing protein [Terriglobia bacterium]
MAKKVGGPEQLLVEELQDLFDAEKQLVRALPKMAKAANDEELTNALRQHLEVTKGQVQRLEQVFQSMDMRPRSRPCKGMQGIVEEGQQVISEEREEGIQDSAICGGARKVEHYEMVSYESARSLAQQMGMRQAAQLLDETLREEIQTDKQLAQISKRLVKGTSSGRRTESASRETSRSGGRQSSGRASGRSSSRESGGRSASGRSSGRTRLSGRPLTDHEEIRRWAEERNARPSCVKRTGGRGDTGMIRLNFPGYTGEESLQDISWDDWFGKFDEKNLALMVQDSTATGERSNFNKLVSRQTAQQRPRTRAAG